MRILITGSTHGIGKDLAIMLSKQGHEIIGVDKEGDSPPEVYTFYTADVAYQGAIQAIADDVGFVDIIINNAGENVLAWVEDLDEDSWDKVMDTNAKGIYNTTHVFAKQLIERKGTIINILSDAAERPMTNSLAYNASKAAARMMTLQLARELGSKGVTVFGVSPSKVAGTKMSAYVDAIVPILRDWTEEYAQEYEAKNLKYGVISKAFLCNFIGLCIDNKDSLHEKIIKCGY